MSSVDEVRDRLDIVDVVGDHVALRKSGRTFTGLCPFHDERTPSFVVSPERGTWRCFGACGVGGDAFDFVMRIENVDFRRALEMLARRVGVELEPPSPRAAEQKEQRDRYRSALDAAADFYHGQLSASAAAEPARAYLASRAFDDAAVREFQLGWAPDAWAITGDALRARGFDNDALLAAGLLREREGGGVYDTFRGRLMFPIRDVRGRVVGFGARTLDPEGVPKYLNSPQGPLFDKSKLLYGLDRAVAAIRIAQKVVVVEGYTDVIRAHSAGFANVVASLGTALTEHHVMTLKRHAPTIVLALDADAAGQAATIRGLEVAREAAGGDVVPVPTATGWVRYQQKLDVELRVAVLPAGQDPDDVVRDDPGTWARLVDGAQPVMDYLFVVHTADLDLDSPDGKTTAADRLLPVIAEMPDPVARAAWVSRLSDVLHIDERALAARILRSGRSTPGRTRSGRPATGAPPAFPLPGEEASTTSATTSRRDGGDRAAWILGHLLEDPRRLDLLAEKLRMAGQPPIGPDDMAYSADRNLLEAVLQAACGATPPDALPEHRIDELPADLAARAEKLRARALLEPALSDEARSDALATAVLRVREEACNRRVEELHHLLADPEAGDRTLLRAQVIAASSERMSLVKLLSPRIERAEGKVDGSLNRR